MTVLADRTRTALEPVRAALLSAAEGEARALVETAEAEARELLEDARRQRDQILGEARARGAADGAMRLSAERAGVQREARRVVLGAQLRAYDELRRQAVAAVRQLLDVPAERARLTGALRSRLGPEALVRDHPRGGLVGESGAGRGVDASVDALVDLALSNLDLESLWTPS